MPASVKFAHLGFVKNHDEIPVKYNVIKQNREQQLPWYVDKYNPILKKECSIAGENGLSVLLPLTSAEAKEDKSRAEKILQRTVSSLCNDGIEIFKLPNGFEKTCITNAFVADGTHLFPFLLCHALKIWEESTRRSLRRCEAVVVHNTLSQTESILNHICDDLNFVTVLDLKGEIDELNFIADKIFDETGLNVVIRSTNKAALRSADIAIQTSTDDFDTAYKRNALVFDLSGNIKRSRELRTRRQDISVVDSLKLKYKHTIVDLISFEMALYAKSRSFRQIVAYGYDADSGEELRRYIKRLGLGVMGLSSTA